RATDVEHRSRARVGDEAAPGATEGERSSHRRVDRPVPDELGRFVGRADERREGHEDADVRSDSGPAAAVLITRGPCPPRSARRVPGALASVAPSAVASATRDEEVGAKLVERAWVAGVAGGTGGSVDGLPPRVRLDGVRAQPQPR